MPDATITDEDIAELEEEYSKELHFNECRKNAIKQFNDIQACAGSGKTTLLAMKLIILAKKWKSPHKGICVLTHTNAAKKEILEWLQSHPSGYRLLSYPHFIGTIQEFVNKFLAIPYLKSIGFSELVIDDERCFNYLDRRVSYGTKKWLSKRFASLYDLKYWFNGEKIELTVPGFTKKSDSESYKDLVSAKKGLIQTGFFFFREMYEFANIAIHVLPDLPESLCYRFPFLFIDEMQDTQKFQDELLRNIFSSANVTIQCFGDPDQSIFDGIGGEMPNESYNQAELDSINESHRFGNDIAHKISGFSYNELEIQSIRKELEGTGPHTIIIFNDETITNVLPAYGKLTHDYFSKDESLAKNYVNGNCVAKAIGAIGAEKPDGLTIKHYWSEYDKRKNPKSLRPLKLIHIVKNCSLKMSGNTFDDYDQIIKGVLEFLFKVGQKTTNSNGHEVYFNKTSLYQSLELTKNYSNFRRLMTTWIVCEFPSETTWSKQRRYLCELLNINLANLPNEAKEYLDYDASIPVSPTNKKSSMNIYNFNDVLDIQVGTIHSVKGETHDATLVLETKFYRYFDLNDSLEHIINEKKAKPVENHASPKSKDSIHAKFLKQLYVATTRARYLVCLAIHDAHISDEQERQLIEKGWKIQKV